MEWSNDVRHGLPPAAARLLCLLLVAGSALAQDTVRARVVARINEEAPTPFFFGEVSGFTLDVRGRLYVSDFKEAHVAVFDALGKHLATIGRRGKGPGEFDAPVSPALGPDGSLYVRNLSGIQRFGIDAKTSLATKFDTVWSGGPAFPPWRWKGSGMIDSAGRYYLPLHVQNTAERTTAYFFIRHTLTGRLLDTIGVPRYPTAPQASAWFRTGPNGGRMVRGLNTAPFEAQPAWTLTPWGSVISGPGDAYVLEDRTPDGRVAARITRPVAPVSIPDAERADSLRALNGRIDSLPVALDQLLGASASVVQRRIAATYPPYTGVLATPEREVWVRRWSTAAETTQFDVFSRSGTFRRTVRWPVTCAPVPAPVVSGRTGACLHVDAATGAETVALIGW